jgi:hypothetical protein
MEAPEGSGMKTARQSTKNYWLNFGRRAAASGYSLEWLIAPIKPEHTGTIELLKEGHAAELKRIARKAKK